MKKIILLFIATLILTGCSQSGVDTTYDLYKSGFMTSKSILNYLNKSEKYEVDKNKNVTSYSRTVNNFTREIYIADEIDYFYDIYVLNDTIEASFRIEDDIEYVIYIVGEDELGISRTCDFMYETLEIDNTMPCNVESDNTLDKFKDAATEMKKFIDEIKSYSNDTN